MNVERFDICPRCAENIKPEAKVCPHCRVVLGRFNRFQQGISTWFSLLLLFAVFIAGLYFLHLLIGPKEQLENHRTELSIIDSQFTIRTSGSNNYVVVMGMMTNSGTVTWKHVAVEGQLFDASGMMVDTVVASAYGISDSAVMPGGTASFKVETKAARPLADYKSCKAYVRWARDARAWP